MDQTMETSVQSRPSTPYRPLRNRAYQTTYQREFSAFRKAVPIEEGIPAGQQFPIGAPHRLEDPIGETSYSNDYDAPKEVQREPNIRPNTSRANRPHPHPQFTHWPRRPQTANVVVDEATKQALRNQLYSTYQVDYIGAPQGFPLPLAYNRSRSFWRNRGNFTHDSEYRVSYRNAPQTISNPTGRYGFSCRVPAEAIIPLTLPLWRKGSSRTTYVREFNEKVPSEAYMKDFVDSFSGSLTQ